ncbi:hypothetical protein MCP_2178 [Methanocella paludicola SANAE]|uniref:Uncharacterized protein n=1 Tax=Methanocella paludicola (strain DSM 17711 / JCM 13418 / NBRC 101707 / SANAE) TaxID=304371 RepID=D1Z0M8_METPS|nr:hypothetical protein [Methanocella paludicola]BAI62250.1 hypothetical protein MCP_2178 [Methanocella paludicola SANAE]
MKVNIDEYDVVHYCFVCRQEASQPRAVISMSMDKNVNGEVHMHKKMGLEHHGGPMIQDRRENVRTSTFNIDDESRHYETCARIVMDYIDKGFEITYLKLG